MLSQLPASKREAARRLLAPLGPVAGLEPLSGGLSGSGVWRVRRDGGDAILKIERPPDGSNDYGRQYGCMALAAEAGVAPRLLAADAEAGVAVIEHIQARPLPGREVMIGEAAVLLRRLHAAPAFPPLIDFPEGVEQLIGRLLSLGLVEPAALDPLFGLWSRLRPACRWGEDGLVASHNDPNPRNLVWDGRRLWLIDWEAAFLNDPFVDLAIVANFLAPAPIEADLLLERYFGAPPGKGRRERLELMRQVCRIYYGAILMGSAAGWSPTPEARRLQGPPLAEIIAGVGAGSITLADPADRFALGAAMVRELV